MSPITSCTLDVPPHLIFHLLHNLPSNDFKLMGKTAEFLHIFLTGIHIFSSPVTCERAPERYLGVRAVAIQSLDVWVPPVFWEWRDVIVCQSIPNPVNKEKLSLAHICGLALPGGRKSWARGGERLLCVPGWDHLPSSMQEQSSFKTKQGRTRREKAKRMDPAGISSVKGVCFRERNFSSLRYKW